MEEIFPFEFIENDFLVSGCGKVAAGFRFLSLPDAGSQSEEALQGLHYSIVQSFSSLPVGTIFQKIDIFYEEQFHSRQEGAGFLGQRWMAHFHYRPTLSHCPYIFLIFSGHLKEGSKNAASSFFAKGKKGTTGFKNAFENPLQQVEQIMNNAETGISACLSSLSMIQGLKLERLKNLDLGDLVFSYLNLSFGSKNGALGLNKTISNTPQAFKIGHEQIAIISMTGQGPAVSSSVRDCFNVQGNMVSPIMAALDFPHIVTQSVLICDTQAELRKLDLLRSMLHSFSGQRDQDGEIQESGLLNLSAEIRKQGHDLIKLSVQICIFHPDPTVLSRQTDKALSGILSMDGTRACIENYDTGNLFFASIPGNASENYRWILMPAVNGACYLNFQKFFRSDSEGLLLCDRYKQPVYINFWNEGLDNKNKLIIGPSGSGKSFTVNSFITQHYHDGDQVLIIDIGGSYKALFQVMEGKYIEYHPEKPLRFNPFNCERNESDYILSQEKINFLLSLVSVLWKNKGEELGKTERAVLRQLIILYYEHLADNAKSTNHDCDYLKDDLLKHQLDDASLQPGMNSFFSFLTAQNQGEIKNPYLDLTALLIILKDYTGKGTRAQLLNSSDEIDISNYSLICFDLNGIKEDETLFPIISLLIIELVLGKIRKFPEKRKHIYMDEAWSMLKETLGDFVMSMYRTIRKSNGAITIITQGINEIEASPVGMAILQNAATKILLDHSSATQFYETLRISLGLTSHEMDLLRSIRKNEKEGWREFFVKFGSEARVFILDAPKEARIAFDSRIPNREKLRLTTLASDGNIELAINEIMGDRRANDAS